MILDYLEVVDINELQALNKEWDPTQLGANVVFNTNMQEIDADCDLVIISVAEDRSSTGNPGCGTGVNESKKELYQLYTHFNMPKIIDLIISDNKYIHS